MPHPLDAHFAAAATTLAGHSRATSVVRHGATVTVAACGAGAAGFNPAFVLAAPTAVEVAEAHAALQGTGRPYCFHVAAPLLAVTAPLLTARGLVECETLPGMARLATTELPAPPPGVRIERVSDEAALRAHAIAIAVGFGSPDPLDAIAVLPPSLLDDDGVVMFNAYVDGAEEPVGTAVAVYAAGVGGIYAVTVLDHARRRGIGAAVTWAAVAATAAMGAARVALQATEMGEPLYRAMGFVTERAYHRFAPAA